jgi:hypothetical protein
LAVSNMCSHWLCNFGCFHGAWISALSCI